MSVKQYIGIDMAKNTFDACFGDGEAVKTFSNTPTGILTFFRTIHKKCEEEKTVVIGVESTAVYHLPLAMRSTEKGYTVRLINPLITNKYSQRNIRKTKTDKIDARIVRYCTIQEEGCVFQETSETLRLKQLIREREWLAHMKLILNGRSCMLSYKEAASKTTLPSVNKEFLLLVEQKMREMEKEIRQYRKEEQTLLQSIPGVGPLTAAAFISEVQDIAKFKTTKQLIAYIGIDPKVHQSGTSIDKYRRISKRGNKILRTRLYNACSVAVLHNNQFQTFFRQKRSEGKPYRVALIATTNKMARIIYGVWKHSTPYQEPQ